MADASAVPPCVSVAPL